MTIEITIADLFGLSFSQGQEVRLYTHLPLQIQSFSVDNLHCSETLLSPHEIVKD